MIFTPQASISSWVSRMMNRFAPWIFFQTLQSWHCVCKYDNNKFNLLLGLHLYLQRVQGSFNGCNLCIMIWIVFTTCLHMHTGASIWVLNVYAIARFSCPSSSPTISIHMIPVIRICVNSPEQCCQKGHWVVFLFVGMVLSICEGRSLHTVVVSCLRFGRLC